MIEPKPISRICAFAILVSVMTGCTSTQRYLQDRRRDVADIFTLCGGVGGGGQVRVGRIPIGAVAGTDVVGLRYGEFFRRTEISEEPEEANTALSNSAVLGAAAVGETVACWFAPCEGGVDRLTSLHDDMYWACGGDFPLNDAQVRRGKGRSSPGSPEWFTVEVLGGIGPMARVGFNAAELLDFAVGWTTIDILGDDRKGQERRMARLAAEKAAKLAARKTCRDAWRSRYAVRPKDVSERAVRSVASATATSAQPKRVGQREARVRHHSRALGGAELKGASTVEHDAQSARQTPHGASGFPGRLRAGSALETGRPRDLPTGRKPVL